MNIQPTRTPLPIILIYVADSVLEYMYRQETDIHGVDLCDIPETFGDEKDELCRAFGITCVL